MEINQAEEWHRLTEHYRGMLDGELEELADSFGDLTETAQQVLRNELRNRGLDEPDAPKTVGYRKPVAAPRFASSVDPDAGVGQADGADADEEGDSQRDYTWKTPLCDCETSEQAYQLKEVLELAGIDSWVEEANSRLGYPRVVVAADQLELAVEIAQQPIPRDIVEESKIEVPEYVAPTCPKCGAEDPVLESAEPTNSWLCEACGEEWREPEMNWMGIPKRADDERVG